MKLISIYVFFFFVVVVLQNVVYNITLSLSFSES